GAVDRGREGAIEQRVCARVRRGRAAIATATHGDEQEAGKKRRGSRHGNVSWGDVHRALRKTVGRTVTRSQPSAHSSRIRDDDQIDVRLAEERGEAGALPHQIPRRIAERNVKYPQRTGLAGGTFQEGEPSGRVPSRQQHARARDVDEPRTWSSRLHLAK